MKSMWTPLAAIFFMTYLYRAGGHGPLGTPPGSATVSCSFLEFFGLEGCVGCVLAGAVAVPGRVCVCL